MLLLISDDPALVDQVGGVARSLGLGLSAVPGVDDAYSGGTWAGVALVLVDWRRPGNSSDVGRLLRRVATAQRPVSTVALVGPADDAQAEALRRLGVAACIPAPVDPDRLGLLAGALMDRSPEGGEGDTPEVDRILHHVLWVAPLDATVLLAGEAGAGKSRLARLIHELSGRRDEPFVVVDCGTPSAGPIRVEDFPARGTLLLEEVDALPMAAQSRLLRAVEAAGRDGPPSHRARLIASSRRDLAREVESGRFRSDLYYRLNVVGLHLPPLRERRREIAGLAGRFLAEFAAQGGRGVESISGEALRVLEAYDWPGNVRELRSLVERAVAIAEGPEVRAEDLPLAVLRAISQVATAGVGVAQAGSSQRARLTQAQVRREAELARITEALQKNGNNRLRTALALGISRMTLYKKLYKYGLMARDGDPGRAVR